MTVPPVASRSPHVGTRLPATVFLPPGLPSALLERSRLEDLLGPPGAGRLSAVIGAAGFGKTTLVRSWLRRAEHTWAWVTLDEPDCTADRFWRLLIGAVQVVRPALILDAVDLFESDPVDVDDVARTFVNDLVEADLSREPLVIVIDDAHLLAASGWQQVAWLLQHQPTGFHIVLASRIDPPFSLARLQASGTVSVVREAQLTFEASETERLFATVLGSDDQVTATASALHARTEGWAAGLRLALLALQHGADAQELESHVAGWQGTIAELLVSEVLDHQPPAIRHFLRCTSIASTLEPGLCNALTERTDSRELLHQLAADHVFLSPVEDTPDHYRFHPMLAQLLRFEARAEQPALEAELHRRAARWYMDRDSPIDAIDHLLAAGDTTAMCDVVIANLPGFHVETQRAQVAAWLAAVPEDYVATDPDRAVSLCAALLITAQPEWSSWWERCDRMVGDDRADLRRRLNVCLALGLASQGRSEQFFDIIRQIGPGQDDTLEEFLPFARAQMLSLDGDHEEAVAVASALVAAHRAHLLDVTAGSLLARTLHEAGERERAQVIAERAVQGWRELGEPATAGVVDALALRAEALCEFGDLDTAEDLAALAVALCDMPLVSFFTVRAALALGTVDAARGECGRARQRLLDLAESARLAQFGAPLQELIERRLTTISASTGAVKSPDARRVQLDEQLTERELEILPLLRSHLTFPEIAQELYVSRHTVKTHVSRIYRKLGVGSRSAALREAKRRGLLP